MALGKNLAVGQPASVVTEATRLVNDACEGIKLSRETIRAALREMGAASDISEASGPVRSRPLLPEKSSSGRLEPAVRKLAVPLPTWPQPPPPREWAVGNQPAGAEWTRRPPPARAASEDLGVAWPPPRMPVNAAWPPAESLPRPKLRGEEGELSALMRGMMNAQANDNGWPTFSGKFMEYPRFRREWWAYRQTYHRHVRDELVCRCLKEKSLASNVRVMVNDIDDLREVWDTLNTCYDRPDRYISEALEPVVTFRVYKPFDSGAVREFYSLLRAAMMGARKAGMLGRLINDQTLPDVLRRMPPMDWRQWARERPNWMRESTEEAFWNFVDQKWRDALNVAAAEPPAWGAGSGGKVSFQEGKREAAKLAKAGAVAIHKTGAEGQRPRQSDKGRACIFKGAMGCTGTHPPWFCRAFGKLPAKEREKLIVDNRLCPFCLLHDKDKSCGARQKPASVACTASGCKGRHAQRLHDFLKDIFREEGQVHVLQEDDGWEESEEAWELEGAEGMIVVTVRQEEEGYSWQDACKAREAQDGEVEASIHQVRADEVGVEQREGDVHREVSADGQSEAESEGLLVEGDEREYILELLMQEVPPDVEAGVHPARAELAALIGKRKRNLGKELCKRLKMAKSSAIKEPKKEGKAEAAERKKGQATTALTRKPGAKGGGPGDKGRGERGQSATPTPTSGGECSK
jgi:hypothetical protein